MKIQCKSMFCINITTNIHFCDICDRKNTRKILTEWINESKRGKHETKNIDKNKKQTE
jgi:hypothetical protein